MKKYVDAENVLNEIKRFVGYLDEDMIFRINLKLGQLPAADVAPVVHGRWVEESDRWNHWHCSECGHVVGAAGKLGGKFCENCGARMDGEADAEK